LKAIPAPRRRPHPPVLAPRVLGLLRHGGPTAVACAWFSPMDPRVLSPRRSRRSSRNTSHARGLSGPDARPAAAFAGDEDVLTSVREGDAPLPAAAEICARAFGEDVRLAALLGDE
jgi:hypothetical protein